MESIKEDKSQQTIDRPSSAKWLEVVLIFAVFFVAGGSPAPHVNETYYLTKAKHYWQPEWCAGDPFLESADAHTVFYWSVGWLANFFPLTAVAWAGRTIAWLLLAWSWQRLSSRICTQRWLSVLSAMMFVTLIYYTNFAGEWVIGGVEGKCYAYAFVFCGLSALVDNRWNAVWPWLGLASAFHVLVGGWSVPAAGIVWLKQSRQSKPSLKQMLPALVMGAIFSLSGVIPGLQLTSGVDPEITAEANRIYTFDRLPHHLAPLSLPLKKIVEKTIPFEILLFGFFLLWIALRRESKREFSSEDWRLERLMQFGAASLVFFAIGMLWHVANWGNPLLSAKLLKYYFFRLSDIAVPIATSLGTIWLILRLLAQKTKLAGIFLALAVAFPGWHLMHLSSTRYQNPIPPGDKKLSNVTSWQEACRWARENTPHDTLFLVPRTSQSFNWYAQRPELVTWKEVPQNAEALLVWRERYYDVFFYEDEYGELVPYDSLGEQGTQRIQSLAQKYQLDYVLADQYPPLDLPVAYSNDYYTIYELNRVKK